ncbi:MAG: hypothetical protein ABI741_11030, partial [Ferruginibacter sp.]
GVIGYDVYYCDGTYIGFTSNTFYNHTGRNESTTYSYKIDAQQSASCVSANTNCVNATTFPSCTPPQTPTAFTATAISSSEIDLSWNAVPGVIGYDVYYCDGTYIGFTANTFYNHTGRLENTTYSYKIDAQVSGTCASSYTTCVSATTFPISPTINISSSQIPPWQREGDDFNGYISVDLSSAGANATWHLEVDYFNTNGFQGSIIYPTLSSANTTQNFSTLTDIQLQIQAIAGNYFTWNVVLESNNSSLTASQQTNIIEKKWSDKNIIYNNDPNGNNEIRIPAKYDPSNSPINITFSRTTGSSSATDNLFANGINFNIGIDGYFHINPNNSNLETVSPGVFDYTIYYTNPFTSESGQLDLTKIGSYGGFHTGNDTLVILIGGNSNSIESDIGNLTGTDPNKDFSIAQNFNYLNATFNTWYIAQPNTNFIENNGYDLGTGIESIIRICQTNGSDIHHIFLLGHSFGGVQIRAMLGGKGRKLNVPIDVPFSTYNISPQIEKVIFLASPHRGVVFFAGSFLDINVAGNAGTEMTAGSQFLTDVDNANLPLGIKFLNITGNDPTNILTTTFSLQPSDGIVPVWSSQNPTLKKTSNTYFLYPELSQLYVNQDVSGLFLHTEIHRTTILNSTSDVCDVSQSILDRIFQFVRGENVNTSTSSVMVSGGGTFCNSATLVANSSVGEPIYWQGTTSGGVSIMTLSSSQIVTSSGTYYFRSLNSWNDPQSGESGICWGTEGSATVIINNIGNNWTGAISTAWENPGNWACGVVPDANTDVVINNGTVIVNSMANCRTLTLLPGVNFTISAGYNLVINH